MKIADLKTDTVVYAVSERGGTRRYPAVVLDTARWQRRRARVGGAVGYEPAPVRGDRHRDTYNADAGMLVVQYSGSDADAHEVGEAEILDRAARIAVEIKESGYPTVPPSYRVRIVRPREVYCTWAEHLVALSKERQRAQRENAARERRAAEQNAARDRLRTALGQACPAFPPLGSSWVELESMCRTYHEAMTRTAAAATYQP